jgi:hypothetical protein
MAKRRNARKAKKKSKPKGPTQAQVVKYRAPSMPLARISRRDVELVCGVNDPFCEAAKTAKIMDNSGVRTLNYPLHVRYALNSNADGAGCYAFLPQYTNAPFIKGTVTGSDLTTVVFGGVFTSGNRIQNVSGYRINSGGFILRNQTAPLYSSGMVHIRGYNLSDNATWATPGVYVDAIGYNCDFSLDIPLQDVREVAIVLARTSPQSVLFRNVEAPAADIETWVSPGWGLVTVAYTGVPVSTTPLDVEIFMNYELIFKESETTALLASPAPRSSPVLKEAADYVSSSMGNVFIKGVKQATDWTINAATKAIGGFISSRLGLGPGVGASMAGTMVRGTYEVD